MAKIKRPIVRTRNAEGVDWAKIVEASSPAGTSLLIGLHTASDDRILYVSPYRADRDVYLMVGEHDGKCAVFTRRDDARRCDCGACLTYDATKRAWVPTHKPAEQAAV